jgi:signal transduction histidine kinase/ActR/RegA family two-component response regulator
MPVARRGPMTARDETEDLMATSGLGTEHLHTRIAELEAQTREAQEALGEMKRARDTAEAASAAKSRYLASVSHEIRSPLNSIYGYAQLLERGHHIAPAEAARIIRRSAEHLTNLVEGLLDISHVESGVLRISNDTVRIAPFLDQIANMFRPQASARGIEFIYDCQGALPEFVRTDQKRLRQILINLLSNAVKFTRAGHVAFRVRFRASLVTVTVEDTGIGIAPEDRERIFAPFERGSQPEVDAQRGIGLGLAITQALVRIMGGDLAMESVKGKGTKFTLRLMLGQVNTAVLEGPRTETITGYEGRARSILCIDDDANQLALLRGLLVPLGFVIHSALDGTSGLALADIYRPELVLLDITMPGLTGWEVARRLREKFGADIRIVMVSADAHEFQRAGAGFVAHDQFLLKPIELNALIDAVGGLLRLRWQGENVEPPEPAAPTPETVRLSAEALPLLVQLERDIKIGHLRAVEKSIRELSENFPDSAPIIPRLHACLDRFDLSGLAAAVRQAQQGVT